MRSRFPIVLVAALFILVLVPLNSPEVSSKQSSPDAGGYRYTDGMGDEPTIDPVYYPVKGDPNAVGLDTRDYGNAHIKVNLGFNFVYYGQTFSSIYVNTYGAMSFTEASYSPFQDYWSYSLPSTSAPKGLMAVYWTWDYCQTTDKDRLFTLNTRIDGEDVFIVEWNTQRGGQFQAVLFKSGMILFNYKTVQSSYVPGSYCIIGIESPDSTTGTPYVKSFQYTTQPAFELPFSIAFTKEDMSVDRIEFIDGDGAQGNKIYAGSRPYTFRTDVSHSRLNDDILNVVMTLGSKWNQEKIQLAYFNENRTFIQLTGFSLAELKTDDCTAQKRATYGLEVRFSVDFKIPYPSEDRRNVSVRATGKASIPGFEEVEDLYYVEDDLTWDPDELVARRGSSDGIHIQDGDYVAGGEQVHFSGFRIMYERSDIQPPPKIIQLNISDNHGTKKISYIPQDGQLSATWQALDQTAVMTLKFKVFGVPSANLIPESPHEFEFKFNVDATPPGDLSKPDLHIYQDELGGSEEPFDDTNDIHYDNDDAVFVEWGTISDGESGIGSYMVEVKKEGYYQKKIVPFPPSSPSKLNTHLGERVKEALPEGRLNLSVRAVDLVGNIGPSIFTTLVIDKEGPKFRLLTPAEGEWAMSTRPTVQVEITDTLSPVDGQELWYRSSTNDGLTYTGWESFEYYGKTKNNLVLEIQPNLKEGMENVLEIKGQDLAGSGVTFSEELPVWVDSRSPSITMEEPDVDENGTTIEWLKESNQPLRILIHDHKGIGIDPTGMSYRYSLGNGNFSADIPLEGEPYNNSYGYEEYSLIIRKDNWQEGDGNILVIDAWDKLGRNTTAYFRIRMDVMPEVEIVSPIIGDTYLDNQSIWFTAVVTDQDGEDDITTSWMSNIDGPISYKSSVETYLSVGQHIITLTVNDGVHSMKRSFSIVVISAMTEDPAFRDSDGDGMNDSYELKFGLDPNIKDGDGDLDGDGYTNLEEYYADTDPTNGKKYPGSSIKEYKLPILPIVLIAMGLLGLVAFGALMVRESNRTPPPDAMMIPLPAYQQQRLQAPAANLPALPPVQK